jgi:hypothetical protein
MPQITRAQIANQLTEGLNTVFGLEYDAYEPQWSEIFDSNTTKKAYEEDQQMVGLGAAAETPEGAMILMDGGREGWTARYEIAKIALGFPITEEAIEDNVYGNTAQKMSRALAKSFVHTKETRGANILNRSTNSSYTGGDGVELCGVHTLADGSTFQNELATAADLSEESIEDLCNKIAAATDEKSLRIALKPRKLIVARNNMFTAERILGSTGRPGTALNDINVINKRSILPDGYCVNHYVTDQTKFWIKTDSPDGLKHFVRRGMRKKVVNKDETGSFLYLASERYAFGWTDWRALFGNG